MLRFIAKRIFEIVARVGMRNATWSIILLPRSFSLIFIAEVLI
jgi:hypothetical protein